MFSFFRKNGPPNAATVMKRVVIFKNIFVKGLATPSSDFLQECKREWSEVEWNKFVAESRSQCKGQIDRLRDSGLWSDVEQGERKFLEAAPTEVTQQALIDASWLAESACCLMWALGYRSELPPYDSQADPEILKELPAAPARESIKAAKLRSADFINRQRDLAELWHWRSRTRQLQESEKMPASLPKGLTIENIIDKASTMASQKGDIPTPINGDFPAFGKAYRDLTREEFASATSIAQERHRAFNWLCGYAPRNKWSQTPTDT